MLEQKVPSSFSLAIRRLPRSAEVKKGSWHSEEKEGGTFPIVPFSSLTFLLYENSAERRVGHAPASDGTYRAYAGQHSSQGDELSYGNQ